MLEQDNCGTSKSRPGVYLPSASLQLNGRGDTATKLARKLESQTKEPQ